MTPMPNSSLASLEIMARKCGIDDPLQPRRLLIIPSLGVISDIIRYAGLLDETRITWDFHLIKEVMEWSDVLNARTTWRRMVVAAQDCTHTRFREGGDFGCVWSNWTAYMSTTDAMQWTNYIAGGRAITTHGRNEPEALQAGCTFYDKHFFDSYANAPKTEAWSAILRDAGCTVRSEGATDDTLHHLFMDGCVTRNVSDSDAPEEVVILNRLRFNGKTVIAARAFAIPVG